MMKGTDRLVRLYDRLEPSERVRLALSAAARGDDDEVRRLVQACPQKTCTVPDPAYTRLVDDSLILALTFSVAWLRASKAYHTTKAACRTFEDAADLIGSAYVAGATDAWVEAGRDGLPTNLPTGAQSRRDAETALATKVRAMIASETAELLRSRAATLRGVHEGLRRFCRGTGTAPEAALVWVRGVLAEIEAEGNLLTGDVPPSEAVVREVEEMLAELWQSGS